MEIEWVIKTMEKEDAKADIQFYKSRERWLKEYMWELKLKVEQLYDKNLPSI